MSAAGMTATTRNRKTWRRRALGLLVVLLFLPVGSFLVVRGLLGAANSWLEREYPPPGKMIAVGDHRLHLYCQGTGAPTVVIETGLGVDWVAWAPVVLNLAQSSEACVYDRAGYGWSEPGPMPRSAAQSATELHDLLAASGHTAPVVLVAHSFGGHIARIYATRYPAQLAGVVLVDPVERDPDEIPAAPAKAMRSPWSVSGLVDRLPPLGWERVKRLQRGEAALPPGIQKLPAAFRQRAVVASSLDQLAAEQSELESARASQVQASAAVFPRDVPLTVVTPLYSQFSKNGAATPVSPDHRERLRKLAAASASGTQVFAAESGHMVQIDQPDLLVTVVREMLSRVRQDRQ
jgi:pimeloyl-ACP methyl ester carboxylesterase